MYSNVGSDNLAVGYALGRDSNGNNNNGMWGDGMGIWAWIILIVLFGGWGWGGNSFGGFGGGNGNAQFTDAAVQRGFDTQSILGKLDGINNGLCDGFYAVNTSLLNGFNGVDNAICQSQFATQQGFNATQMAMMQGFNAAQAQAADCCCRTQTAIAGVENSITGLGCTLGREIERGFCDSNYNLATQSNAIQVQMANNTRDIIDSQNAGTRAILDYLCQEKISDLQQENQTLRLAASQQAQNNYLVEQLRPAAKPAYLTCSPFASAYGFGYGFPYGLNGYSYNNNGCGCNSGCCGCNG